MLAYHLGPRGAFAPGSGPRRLLPTDGITIGAKSRALIEAENCLNQFQAYRTSALSATFQIKVVSGYARCSTAIQYLPLTLVATPTLPLFTMVETPIQRFGPYSHDVNPNTNNEEYWFDPVLWKHDWQIATMAAVTSGPPSFNRIYFQAYRANMTNPLTRSCKDWNAIGNAGEVHADVQAHPASAGEITGLGLQGIANPYVFSFQIPEASMTTRYRQVYADWQRNPESFWAQAAREVDWITPPTRIFDEKAGVYGHWFPDAQCNTCWNAVDRHLAGGRGAQDAIIYDSPLAGAKRRVTYAQLLDEVSTLAAVLRDLGVGKGDRVIVYMPMIPEALFAMLACARIGAIHSVVFGGFAAKELATRIDDAAPKAVLEGVSKEDAEKAKEVLEAAGGSVEVK